MRGCACLAYGAAGRLARFLCAAAGLFSLLAVTACVSVSVTEHAAVTDLGAPPARILVLSPLDDTFAHDFSGSMADALRSGLLACSVDALVYSPNSLRLDSTQTLAEVAAGFKPDAIMNIKLARSLFFRGEEARELVNLTLFSVLQKRELWKARITLDAGSRLSDRSKAGELFAARVIRQLAADGVLKNSPPAGAHHSFQRHSV